ncbi:MAG: class II fructose-bisphosphate aldolase, partial [Fusobacteriaceae bacterium]
MKIGGEKLLVTLNEILEDAKDNNYIVPAFNVYGFEDAKAVIEVAEELKASVIVATNRDAIKYMGVTILGNLLTTMAKESSAKVCVHLDHGKSKEEAIAAIEAGYSSVMFDGSTLPFEENVKLTKEIVDYARKHGVSSEAEIGSVGYAGQESEITDPEEAEEFAKRTEVDALAISVGTSHRMSSRTAKINFDILEEIQQKVSVPLVIHGSTGLPDEELKRLIPYKIGKI